MDIVISADISNILKTTVNINALDIHIYVPPSSSGSVAKALDCQSRRTGFKSTCYCFKTWVISFTPLCLCISEEMMKADGPFFLMSVSASGRPHAGKWKNLTEPKVLMYENPF